MSNKPTYGELEAEVERLRSAERERKELEAQLQDELKRWHIMIEQSRDGIVILRPDGSIYETNRQYAEMLGYTLEEVYKLSIWDWDAIYEKDELLELLKKVDEKGAHFTTKHKRKDGTIIDIELSNNGVTYGGLKLIFCVCRDVTRRNQEAEEQAALIKELKTAISEIKTLQEIIPICSYCKKIRDDKGYWEQLETYIHEHAGTRFSHGLCPECAHKHYPRYFNKPDPQS